MGFYHTIRAIQKTKTGFRAVTVAKHLSAYEQPGKASDIVRKAMAWPSTVRVEIEEEDSQLYAYPAGDRSYQHHVLHKDGRMYRFYGKNSSHAYLIDGFDTRKHMHTYRLS